jgi:Tfp pilus assembly protein PilN
LLAALGYVGLKWYSLNAEKSRLEADFRAKEKERQRLNEIIERANRFNKEKELLDKKIRVIEDLKKRQRGPKIMLEQLEKNLPEFVWFQVVSETNYDISIDGFALNANKFADYVTNLTDSGYFTNIEPISYRTEAGRTGFTLKMHFKMP